MKSKKAIVLFATNKYFILALRLISHWRRHYVGNSSIEFFIISDKNPKDYTGDPEVHFIPASSDLGFLDIMIARWRIAAKIGNFGIYDQIIMIDADTSIHRDFSDEEFSSSFTAMEHPSNDDRAWHLSSSFEHNKKAAGYFDFSHDTVYYNAGFLVANSEIMQDIYSKMSLWYLQDKKNGTQSPWHDETYINKYINVINRPEKVMIPKELFVTLGDKGGEALMGNLLSGVFVFEQAKTIDNVYNVMLESLRSFDISAKKWNILDNGDIVDAA